MKRSLLFLTLCGSLLAFGAEADKGNEPPDSFHNVEGDKVSEHEDTATFILNHVSDSEEMEFDVPLKEHGAAPTLHFPMWRIPLKAGACPADEHEAASLTAGCADISLTKHSFMMLVASALLIVALLAFSHRDRNQPVPKGSAANIIELLVLFVRDEIAVANIGKEEGPRYTPYLLSVFFFILAINLLGLIPWMATATGNAAVTLALATCTFLLTQVASIRAAGFGGYLKHLTGGVPAYLWPIMIPVELLGLFTKPFALTLRLFANMLAGHIVLFSLLGLIMILQQPAVAIGAVPFAVAIYLLELFVAFLQAYVFTLLSSIFIGMGVAMGHHDDHGHDKAHGHDDAHGHGGHGHGHEKTPYGSGDAINPANAAG